MFILAQLKPNNKLQLTQYRLAEGYGKKQNKGDDTKIRENTYIGRKLQESQECVEIIKRLAPSAIGERIHAETYCMDALFPGYEKQEWDKESYNVPYCDLNATFPIAKVIPGTTDVVIEQMSLQDVAMERYRALDLLRKSQHDKKTHASWGKLQSPKEFRYQAGQKILEGGSIIDRFCGAENSSMITLTLPGSTWEAMDCLARWSGYVVNRLLQVIRRENDLGSEIYWFFVWEHQKRGALHMHMCLGWKVASEIREQLCQKIKNKWFEVLHELLEKDGTDVFKRKGFAGSWRNRPSEWQWDIQQVRESVAAYFAKYCTKNTEHNGGDGNKSDANVKVNRRAGIKACSRKCISYPTRYWGSSKSIKVRTKFLNQKRKFEAHSNCEANRISDRIDRIAHKYAVPCSVTKGSFYIEDERNGIVIAVGTTKTYIYKPNEFPYLWQGIMNDVIERTITNERIHAEFLSIAYIE